MKLSAIVNALEEKGLINKVSGNTNIEIGDMSYNSKNIGQNCLFVCKGMSFKEEFLAEAVKNNAAAYISEKEYKTDSDIAYIIVKDVRKAMAVCANCFYDYPMKKLLTVGVTGTKGKTTTCHMLRSILSQRGSCGLVGTVEINTVKNEYEPLLSTPESLDLMKYLSEMVEAKSKYAVIEVSSQALKLNRVYDLDFEIGIFINFSEDHISPNEHPDIDDYFMSKMKLFKMCKAAVINGDMDNLDEVKRNLTCEKTVTFGMKENCDYVIKNIRSDTGGISFDVRSKNINDTFKTSIIGKFNAYNAVAAIAAADLLGVSADDMKKGLEKISISGRMNVINSSGITVIVDYAHNEISMRTLLDTVKSEMPGRRIISVYGCPGDKAIVRRRQMGQLSGRLTDYTVLTAEDSNFVDTETIMDEISMYIKKEGGKFHKIADREEAIRKTVLSAREGDIVLILGKGNEKTMMVNGKYCEHGGDLDLAEKYLKQREENYKSGIIDFTDRLEFN